MAMMSFPISSSKFLESLRSTTGSHVTPTPSPLVLVLRLSRTWSIDCPPAKKAMVAGILVPTVKGTLTHGMRLIIKPKRRRLSIEIHGPETNPQAISAIGMPIQRGLSRDAQSLSKTFRLSKELLDDDRIIIRILKPRKAWGFHRDPEDSSDSDSDSDSNSDSDSDNHRNNQSTSSDKAGIKCKDSQSTDHLNQAFQDEDEWIEYRKYGMDEIVDETLTGRNKTVFEATMGLGANQERREFRFETEQQGK